MTETPGGRREFGEAPPSPRPKTCKGCQQERPLVRNRLYCDECREAGVLAHPSRRKPCPKCGGAKEPGKRRYCIACREAMLPVWRQQEYERSQQRIVARRKEREQTGKVPRGYRQANAPEGMRWCIVCQQYLAEDRFSSNGRKGSSYCKPCYSAYAHDQRLRKVYGIDVETYDRLLALQDGRCAVCLSKPRTRRLAVDHDHETGEVRGLLCTRCNHHVIGHAKESPALLGRAIAYLESPPAISGLDPRAYGAWFEMRLEAAIEEAEAAEKTGGMPIATFDGPSGEPLVAMTAKVWVEILKNAADRAA